jgi:hypothetical protein
MLSRSNTLVKHEHWLLTEDYDVECTSGEWLAIQLLLGLPMVMVFVVAIPLLLMYMLREKVHLPEKVSERTRVVFGFLYMGFEKEYYYWEVRSLATSHILHQLFR